MYKCFDNPPLLSYNNAFLTLYKTLIQDDDQWERIDIIKSHRTMIFNEIKFSNDLHKIRNIALPTNPDNNYLLLSIDGVIHKYDLSNKELVFSFKASAYRTMQIYNNDTRILTCDSSIVKIWQFEKDNAELITSLPIEDKIDKFFAPRTSNSKTTYFVGLFQEEEGFKIYKQKLSDHWNWKDRITVTAVDFLTSGDQIVVGTSNGEIRVYDLKNKSLGVNYKVGTGKEINFLSVIDSEKVCVATKEPSVYACSLTDNFADPYELENNKEIVQWMRTSFDRKHLVIGYEDSLIEFWKYHEGTQKFELLKEIKEEFQYFDIDPLWSSMLILNPKGRDIEYHLIEWEWDTSKIDADLQKINLDFENIQEEDFKDDLKPKKDLKISDGKGKKRQTSCCSIF